MDILDCDWKFKFQCPQQWDQLKEGDDQAVRYCETCQRNVYLCTTHQAVGEHASQGHCVVIMIPEKPGSADFDQFGMGEICNDSDDETTKKLDQEPTTAGAISLTRVAACLIVVAIAFGLWLFSKWR